MDENKDKVYSFKLPNGNIVLLSVLGRHDYEALNKWVRSEYIENVTKATANLTSIEKQSFLLAALSQASKMTFQFGEGRDILLGSPFGLCRMVYQLIKNPSFSFDAFYEMMFPDGFLNADGITAIAEMMDTAYQDYPVPNDMQFRDIVPNEQKKKKKKKRKKRS